MTPPIAQSSDRTPASTDVRRSTLAGSVGMYIEFYEYGVYGFFAPIISKVFFPNASSTTGILLTYGIFSITFFFRPLGGVVLGIVGDRLGRKTALVTSLALMTFATTAMGLLPGYAAIGIAAPILLLIFRILQGFSAGGEVSSAMTFVGEHAPDKRRAFFVSFVNVGAYSAMLTATVFGFVLSSLLGPESMSSWGWRIPFLVAAPLGIVAFWIRATSHEAPRFENLKADHKLAKNPLKQIFASRKTVRGLLFAIGLPLLNSSGYYVMFNYLPAYLITELKFTSARGYMVTAAALIVIIIFIPISARLSDRIGRKPVLIGSALGIAIAGYPAFLLMSMGSVGFAILGAAILAVIFSAHTGIIHTVLLESFPTPVRTTAYSLGYNIGTAIFGGAAPLVLTALIASTADKAVPAYYVVLTALGTLVFALFLKESAGTALHDS